VDFVKLDLSRYDVVVMGSNNAVYGAPAIDAIEDFVHEGGGVLFISDLGFGRNWTDAPTSDQRFLDRFGWTMQQDWGTYGVSAAGGHFDVAAHPVLEGVGAILGEGVSPIVRPVADVPGVRTTLLVRTATAQTTRNNDANPGSFRQTMARDAAVIVAQVGCGRLAGHYDRNTFFNANGAGTDIHELDHARYALNLFRWLAAAGPADVAAPIGSLDYTDVLSFLVAFSAEEPGADLAPPFGAWDFSDVLAFLEAFTGCR